jgi:hypothetical protein
MSFSYRKWKTGRSPRSVLLAQWRGPGRQGDDGEKLGLGSRTADVIKHKNWHGTLDVYLGRRQLAVRHALHSLAGKPCDKLAQKQSAAMISKYPALTPPHDSCSAHHDMVDEDGAELVQPGHKHALPETHASRRHSNTAMHEH